MSILQEIAHPKPYLWLLFEFQSIPQSLISNQLGSDHRCTTGKCLEASFLRNLCNCSCYYTNLSKLTLGALLSEINCLWLLHMSMFFSIVSNAFFHFLSHLNKKKFCLAI